MTWFLALLLILQTGAPPHLVYDDTTQTFLVDFDPGYAAGCTIYQSSKDPSYAPQHCWLLNPETSGYTDNWTFIVPTQTSWTVYVELYPPDGSGRAKAVSNRVTVVY